MNDARTPPPLPSLPPGVLVVRPGLGANCSSIGSVVDILFGVGAIGGMVVVGLTAWLEGREGAESESGTPGDAGHSGDASDRPPGDAGRPGDSGGADHPSEAGDAVQAAVVRGANDGDEG